MNEFYTTGCAPRSAQASLPQHGPQQGLPLRERPSARQRAQRVAWRQQRASRHAHEDRVQADGLRREGREAAAVLVQLDPQRLMPQPQQPFAKRALRTRRRSRTRSSRFSGQAPGGARRWS